MKVTICDRCKCKIDRHNMSWGEVEGEAIAPGVVDELGYDLCARCAHELEELLDTFFQSVPVDFPNSKR